MAQRLTRLDDRLALVLEPSLLNRLGLDADTELEVTSDGSSIVVTPVQSKRHEALLKQVAGRVFDDFSSAFERLA